MTLKNFPGINTGYIFMQFLFKKKKKKIQVLIYFWFWYGFIFTLSNYYLSNNFGLV